MAKRRILKAEIKYISLCPRGMNRMPVIYKADASDEAKAEGNGSLDLEMLLKGDSIMDKGELLAVVYSPETPDKEGDVASADVIKEMMYNAAKDGVNIDIRHDEKALKKEQAYVAESFIIQKSDPRFHGFKNYDNQPVDVTGAWGVVLKIEDNDLRKLYKEGKWNGVSMGGRARFGIEKNDGDFDRIVKELARRLSPSTGDDDMTKEELDTGLAKHFAPLAAALTLITTQLQKSEVKTPEVDKDIPVFKGDAAKAEDVAAHQEALEVYQLKKAVNWSDVASVAAFQTAMKARADAKVSKADAGKTDAEKDHAAKLAKAEKELAELKKSSNQSAGTPKDGGKNEDLPNGLSKEDLACAATGSKMAAFINGKK